VQREGVGIKSMQRLVTFGDSITYGQYLDDPKSQSWPAILGGMLDVPVENRAVPGSGNLEILNDILNFKFKDNDIVIIGWSFIYRDLIFNTIKNNRIAVWLDRDTFDLWSKIHSKTDLATRSGLYMHHADLYLKSLNLDCYQFFSPERFNKGPKFIKKPSSWINKTIQTANDFANDNMHPGPTSQKLMAERLFRIINGK
jgi:lysophospholipase L1-like esterase